MAGAFGGAGAANAGAGAVDRVASERVELASYSRVARAFNVANALITIAARVDAGAADVAIAYGGRGAGAASVGASERVEFACYSHVARALNVAGALIAASACADAGAADVAGADGADAASAGAVGTTAAAGAFASADAAGKIAFERVEPASAAYGSSVALSVAVGDSAAFAAVAWTASSAVACAAVGRERAFTAQNWCTARFNTVWPQNLDWFSCIREVNARSQTHDDEIKFQMIAIKFSMKSRK